MINGKNNTKIFLGGFMASGKSAVGKILAEKLHVPFLDTDVIIEQRTETTIAEIFKTKGEPFFRNLERELIDELVPLKNVVIALGGGALVDTTSRDKIKANGFLVVLSVKAETVRNRTISSHRERPLLDSAKIEALLESRTEAYSCGRIMIPTDELSPYDIAEKIIAEFSANQKMRFAPYERDSKLRILHGKTSSGIAPIFIGENILYRMGELLPALSGNAPFIISDCLVGHLYGDRIFNRRGVYLLPRGENAKTMDQLQHIYESFASVGIDRTSVVAALGGGAVGDSGGFAAATWMRGIRLIQCPTTLLAMIDSSLGGKVGVNLSFGKNLAGAFHQPIAVIMDIACLNTLPDIEFRQGLAESVKYGVGEDNEFLRWLFENRQAILSRDSSAMFHLVERCAAIKLAIVEEDEREMTGARARLNLGHTIAHGLEAASDYREWKHGDAVAAGLAAILRLGADIGSCTPIFVDEVLSLLEFFHLPVRGNIPWSELAPYIARDKKFHSGKSRIIIPEEGKRCRIMELPVDQLEKAYVSQ